MIAISTALYFGRVIHDRLRPRRHRFSYKVFWVLFDLDELPGLDRSCRLFSFNRLNLFSLLEKDHGPGNGKPLRPWVEEQLAAAGLDISGGPIRLLCNPRILGYVFNPLSIYFCYRPDGRLAAVIYEVNNTFGDRHCYLLPAEPRDGVVEHGCPKRLFVSPFIDMEAAYRFRLTMRGEALSVTINEHDSGGHLLHTNFSGLRKDFDDRKLISAFVLYPLLTFKIILGIHWEALKLWLKRIRFKPRPAPPPALVSSPIQSDL